MNANLDDHDPSIYYYDSDYPSREIGLFPENFDAVTKYQGLAYDVLRYKEIASEVGGPILELCCGTGRVAIPLAREGFHVTAVDISTGMIDRFRSNLRREETDTAARISIAKQDITKLELESQDFRLAIIAFNSFLCITDFADQCLVLRALSKHLCPGGILILDVVNPLNLKIQGDPIPKPFFTRKATDTGNTYTRFAMMDPFDENHRQRLYGWYDETDSEGVVRRRYYSLFWRPVFRFEIELMLKQSGFEILKIEGGHQKEAYTAQSPRLFIHAKKPDTEKL